MTPRHLAPPTRASSTGASASTACRPPPGWRCRPPPWARPGSGWPRACATARTIRSACWPSPRSRRWSWRCAAQLRAAPRLGWLAAGVARHAGGHGAAHGALPPLAVAAWSPCWRWPAACWPSCRAAWRHCRCVGPRGAGAAAAVVAAVLCGLPAARAHGRGQPLAAGAGLRRGARRQHAAGRRPAGHRRRALLRRADGVARLLHGLRGGAVGAAQRPRFARAAAGRRAAGAGRQHRAQQRAGRASKARASRSAPWAARRAWACVVLAAVCGGIAWAMARAPRRPARPIRRRRRPRHCRRRSPCRSAA